MPEILYFPFPLENTAPSSTRNGRPAPKSWLHRLSQLDALPEIKAEHFDDGSLLHGMDVADGKLLSASQAVAGEA